MEGLFDILSKRNYRNLKEYMSFHGQRIVCFTKYFHSAIIMCF